MDSISIMIMCCWGALMVPMSLFALALGKTVSMPENTKLDDENFVRTTSGSLLGAANDNQKRIFLRQRNKI